MPTKILTQIRKKNFDHYSLFPQCLILYYCWYLLVLPNNRYWCKELAILVWNTVNCFIWNSSACNKWTKGQFYEPKQIFSYLITLFIVYSGRSCEILCVVCQVEFKLNDLSKRKEHKQRFFHQHGSTHFWKRHTTTIGD